MKYVAYFVIGLVALPVAACLLPFAIIGMLLVGGGEEIVRLIRSIR